MLTIQLGSRGHQVKLLQRLLNNAQTPVYLEEDGDFGRITRSQVEWGSGAPNPPVPPTQLRADTPWSSPRCGGMALPMAR